MQIGEIAWEEFEKVGFRHLAGKKMVYMVKWPIPRNSSELSELVDIRFLNVAQVYRSYELKCTFLGYSAT